MAKVRESSVTRRCAVAFAALVALAGTTGIAAAQHQLNINTALTRDDPIYKGLERLRDRVLQRSEGKLTSAFFPGSQLARTKTFWNRPAPARMSRWWWMAVVSRFS